MDTIRAVHYLNQYFGRIGGEECANIGPSITDGPVGPGMLFSTLTKGRYAIGKTIICGDNYAAEHLEELEATVLEWIRSENPDLFIAGPAFAAGRYGTACGHLCNAVATKLKIPVITAMHPVSPGVEIARRSVYIVETKDSARDIGNAAATMVRIADKLLRGEPVGLPGEEGYIPRGVRVNVRSEHRGARRAVDMLVKKLRGEPFVTELPMPTFDKVPPAKPVQDMKNALIAISTEGGIVPRGNPDRIEAHNASKWRRYSIANLDNLEAGAYEVAHGGYDSVPANADPDRVLPLDAARILEREGAFRKLLDSYAVTVGNVTAVRSAERYGREIGEAFKAEGVQGVILTST